MNLLVRIILLVIGVLSLATTARAGGTPAGTDITSQATVMFTMSGSDYTRQSNQVTTGVAEVLDMNLVWQDAASVAATPGAGGRALSFRLTNTGNGSDTYTLAGESLRPGDDFDPVLTAIHLDSNDNGVFDPGQDEIYIAGSNDPFLAADAFTRFFLLNDIPPNATVGQVGESNLTVTSNTGTGSPGTTIPGAGERGLDAVIGMAGGLQEESGSYRIVAVAAQVAILKSAQVTDPFGGAQPVTGATITYSLSVIATGTGTADGVVVSDAIPPHTTYNPGTLTLNGAAVSDVADGDPGDMGVSAPDQVTVALGDLVTGEPGQIISFTVTID